MRLNVIGDQCKTQKVIVNHDSCGDYWIYVIKPALFFITNKSLQVEYTIADQIVVEEDDDGYSLYFECSGHFTDTCVKLNDIHTIRVQSITNDDYKQHIRRIKRFFDE